MVHPVTPDWLNGLLAIIWERSKRGNRPHAALFTNTAQGIMQGFIRACLSITSRHVLLATPLSLFPTPF
jgi:hypothetical protein